jgi:MSHA biogenesis protein MshK
MATGLKLCLTAMLLCISHLVAAELLPDPTRPAIDLGGAGSGVAAGMPLDETVPRGLQSVIISPRHRAAIIDGEMVNLGGKYGNSTLVEVRENSVVLENARGRRVMEMFPKVGIRKGEAIPQGNDIQEKPSGQTGVPGRAAGGIK